MESSGDRRSVGRDRTSPSNYILRPERGFRLGGSEFGAHDFRPKHRGKDPAITIVGEMPGCMRAVPRRVLSFPARIHMAPVHGSIDPSERFSDGGIGGASGVDGEDSPD